VAAPTTIAATAALLAMPAQMVGANHQGGRFLRGVSMTYLQVLRITRWGWRKSG
jgi:hypothetical protein